MEGRYRNPTSEEVYQVCIFSIGGSKEHKAGKKASGSTWLTNRGQIGSVACCKNIIEESNL